MIIGLVFAYDWVREILIHCDMNEDRSRGAGRVVDACTHRLNAPQEQTGRFAVSFTACVYVVKCVVFIRGKEQPDVPGRAVVAVRNRASSLNL